MTEFYTFLTPQESERPYTVSEINDGIATIIESENTLVWVEAEISNFKRASSGHFYMRLKDEESQIPAVMWRSTARKHDFEPEDGLAVTVIASIRVYRKGGYYQLDIHRMQPSGIGALYAAFEKLRTRLEAEGLFDLAHKKPLPETVKTLGVVTAKTGAAIRDIIRVVSKRSPQTDILLRSVPVQGDEAPAAIITAIEELNDYGTVDCIIVGRGGGSVEDLWAFNNEGVVRAIFASHIPIISAVGHEIDFTLSDFAADVRAPTPSAAAEIAVADDREKRRHFDAIAKRFSSALQHYFATINNRYTAVVRNPVFKRAIHALTDAHQYCDMLRERQMHAIAYIIKNAKTRLAKNAASLQALSPLGVLSRGYCAVTTEDGMRVSSAAQLHVGDHIYMRFHKGNASADVTEVKE